MQPVFPLICIAKESELELIPAESYFSKISTSALINESFFKDTLLFDGNGDIWSYKQVSDKFKRNFFTILLAKTFYNPLLDAKVIWTKIGSYEMNELKEKLNNCIDKDDDIITQFAEASTIKSSLSQAATFDDIIKVLNKYVFAVNENELYNNKENLAK
ncbi:MAG: hypothetical protein QM802_26745 [Agriterribacter sp.]